MLEWINRTVLKTVGSKGPMSSNLILSATSKNLSQNKLKSVIYINMSHKNNILKLKESGKSYNEIKDILGCSLGTISYQIGRAHV